VSAVAPTLEAFFTQRLMSQKRASQHTIAAYRVPRTWLSAVSTQEGGRSRLQGFGLAVMVCGAAWAKAGIPRSTVTRRLAAM
jgi:site-specific recombinase XerC